jgi:ketosteroid isomerase-like protein
MTADDARNDMAAKRRALLVEFGRAWGQRDVARLMEMMADDCIYLASAGPEPGRTFRGREEVRRGFELMLAHDAGSESREGRVFVAGDLGVAEWSYAYKGADGTEIEIRGCDIFEFRGEKIFRKDAFRKVFA